MFKLDDNLLRELGLGALPADEKNKMLAHIYETLEMRVGMKLAEKMTNQQLDEFEAFIDKNDEAGALKWLESNFPNYKQVVADELETLKLEIKQAAPQILAASQQAHHQVPPAPHAAPTQSQYQVPPTPAPHPSVSPQPHQYPPQPPSQDPGSPMQPPPQYPQSPTPHQSYPQDPGQQPHYPQAA